MKKIELMSQKNGEPFIQLDKEKRWYWHLDPMAQVSGPRSSGKTFFPLLSHVIGCRDRS